ncbi:hypothetical protein V8C37DRAFT_212172 [Trichoderma ceciliae]
MRIPRAIWVWLLIPNHGFESKSLPQIYPAQKHGFLQVQPAEAINVHPANSVPFLWSRFYISYIYPIYIAIYLYIHVYIRRPPPSLPRYSLAKFPSSHFPGLQNLHPAFACRTIPGISNHRLLLRTKRREKRKEGVFQINHKGKRKFDQFFDPPAINPTGTKNEAINRPTDSLFARVIIPQSSGPPY